MPLTSHKCPECNRTLAIHRKRWQRHYRDREKKHGICPMSDELADIPADNGPFTEADYQTWMRT